MSRLPEALPKFLPPEIMHGGNYNAFCVKVAVTAPPVHCCSCVLTVDEITLPLCTSHKWAWSLIMFPPASEPVSYTHLDVYKRQITYMPGETSALSKENFIYTPASV